MKPSRKPRSSTKSAKSHHVHVVQAVDNQSCNAVQASPASTPTPSSPSLAVRRASSSARSQAAQANTRSPWHTGNAAPSPSSHRARTAPSAGNPVARACPDNSTVDVENLPTRRSARIASRAKNPEDSEVLERPVGSNPIVQGAKVSSTQVINDSDLQTSARIASRAKKPEDSEVSERLVGSNPIVPGAKFSSTQAINDNDLQVQSPTHLGFLNPTKGRRSARPVAVKQPEPSPQTLLRSETEVNMEVSSTQANIDNGLQSQLPTQCVSPNPSKGRQSARPVAVKQPEPSPGTLLRSETEVNMEVSSTQANVDNGLQSQPPTQCVSPNPSNGRRSATLVALVAQPDPSLLTLQRSPTKSSTNLARNHSTRIIHPVNASSTTCDREEQLTSLLPSLESITAYMASEDFYFFGGNPPIEPIGERCNLCRLDLAFTPSGSSSFNAYYPPVHAVLPCGHCYHDSCLVDVFGNHEPSRTPTCIACLEA